MSEPKQIRATVMFADICRSTDLFGELGDQKAARLVGQSLDRAAAMVTRSNGRVLRSHGDDILCIFEEPVDAFEAALNIHRGASEDADQEVSMRVGIHSGTVLLADGDLFGDCVNTAARLVSLAKAGQTVLSGETLESGKNLPFGLIRPLGDLSLKGKSGPVSVFELLDSSVQDEITQVGALSLNLPRSNLLSLRFQSSDFRLDYRLQRFQLGRHPRCDLVVDHHLVSRNHAEIRYRNNEFVLLDFSTNGTELITGGRSRTLHHSQAALRGKGSIFLGGTVYNRMLEIAFESGGGARPFNQSYS